MRLPSSLTLIFVVVLALVATVHDAVSIQTVTGCSFPTERTGRCTGLDYDGDAYSASACEASCCERVDCSTWQFMGGDGGRDGCWLGTNYYDPDEDGQCSPNDGSWQGGSRVIHSPTPTQAPTQRSKGTHTSGLSIQSTIIMAVIISIAAPFVLAIVWRIVRCFTFRAIAKQQAIGHERRIHLTVEIDAQSVQQQQQQQQQQLEMAARGLNHTGGHHREQGQRQGQGQGGVFNPVFGASAPEAMRVSEAGSIGSAYEHQAEATIINDKEDNIPTASVQLGPSYWLGGKDNDR